VGEDAMRVRGGHIIAYEGLDEVGEDDPTSSSHCCIVVLVVLVAWQWTAREGWDGRGGSAIGARVAEMALKHELCCPLCLRSW
jgi:hypothetical protein